MTGYILLQYEPKRISTFRGITTFEITVDYNLLIFTHRTENSFLELSEKEKWDFFENMSDEMSVAEKDSRESWFEDAIIIET